MSEALPIFRTLETFRKACDEARAQGMKVGLVPTMGALHQGHLALVSEACRRSDFVAVSIFVNPTQFGPNEDFASYPRRIDDDVVACRSAGAACVFAPEVKAMYPPSDQTRVRVDGLATHLCGKFRAGHFEGVATIVTKLLALTGPCVAVFGRKDFQQLRVIERLVRDLLLPVEVVGYPTVREADGLAMSSRNAYLSAEDRERVRNIPRALSEAVRAFRDGERTASALTRPVCDLIAASTDSIDYVEIADPETLDPYHPSDRVQDRTLLAVAARVGRARLIDNVVLGEDAPPCGE